MRKRGHSARTSSIPVVPSPPLYIETKREGEKYLVSCLLPPHPTLMSSCIVQRRDPLDEPRPHALLLILCTSVETDSFLLSLLLLKHVKKGPVRRYFRTFAYFVMTEVASSLPEVEIPLTLSSLNECLSTRSIHSKESRRIF